MHDFVDYAAVVEEGQTLHELQQLYRIVQYGHNQVPVRRDNELVAANFKDVEGCELLSPAFTRPETVQRGFHGGTEGPTIDEELDNFLRCLASRNDWMTYQVADYCSEEGRRFPCLLLSMKHVTSESRLRKLRVWVQGAVHGNEPAGDQSILALIGKMDADQDWTKSILSTMDIFMLPRYNPDGVADFQRALASNLDANRDHIKLTEKQTRDIKLSFNEFAPHIAIDMHEFSAPAWYARTYVHAADALFSAAKNLNIDSKIRDLSEGLFATNIGAALEGLGLRWGPYITGSTLTSLIQFAEAGSDAKLGRNAMGLTQAVTFLCETRGSGLGDQHFRRRTTAALVMVESIIQTAADNAEKVYQLVESGIQDFIQNNADVVIADTPVYIDRSFQMIDTKSGKILDVPVHFAGTTPKIASLTRARPEAYIIPVAWAELVTRLEVCGLRVERLLKGFRGSVEALSITSVSFDETYYEGIVPVIVTTISTQKQVELPPGSFAISTRQKNAALAFVALEPENIDSYVAFNIIPVQGGDEYPVYRLMA